MKANQTVNTAGCPSCSETKASVVKGQIYECVACKGTYGTCYLGDSYTYVSPFMTDQDVPVERQRYFDFTCLGSKGISRRHGWYDMESKLMTQVG